MSPAKGLSLRSGDQAQVKSGMCKKEARVWSISRTEQAHTAGTDALYLPFGLAGRNGPGTAPSFGDVWIELCAPSSGSLPGLLGLEE